MFNFLLSIYDTEVNHSGLPSSSDVVTAPVFDTMEVKGEPSDLIPKIHFNKTSKPIFRKHIVGYFTSKGCPGDPECYTGKCEHRKQNQVTMKEVERLGFKIATEPKILPFTSNSMYCLWVNDHNEYLREYIECGV